MSKFLEDCNKEYNLITSHKQEVIDLIDYELSKMVYERKTKYLYFYIDSNGNVTSKTYNRYTYCTDKNIHTLLYLDYSKSFPLRRDLDGQKLWDKFYNDYKQMHERTLATYK